MNGRSAVFSLIGLALGASLLGGGNAMAQAPDVSVGLIAPMSGIYARYGQVMRMGATMGVKDINDQGGIKALGGAKLKLVVVDSGDSTEKAKSAAERMVADYPDLVAATGAYLSSFTLAVTEVTERAKLPVLTLSYSDLITARGFKYVFQTSAPAGRQAEIALPSILELAQKASGKRPRTVAIVTDNTAASLSTVKALKDGLLAKNGLELVVDETFTPPLADASSLIQRVRSRRPDLLFFLPTVISDAKLILEKMNETNVKVPVISFGIAIAEPEVMKTVSPTLLNGVMSAVGNWGAKGQEALIMRMKTEYNEPWMTQNAISTYGDMWIMKAALERAATEGGKKADREAVGQAMHTLDEGPSPYFPGGVLKFDEAGHRVGATLTVIQWQNGVPVTVFPEAQAVAQPIWPGK
ncbi:MULTISPECIES: ABC transporter substrate-binding protein [unclassified Achromobacter]|uniref:ABC transporter substrate-binding protein n=1 Tax=unclassified Achromobacter TaxID=2626865 RepID=UPI000B51A33F|nr:MULTISPECIES: ABC transporter substrate-binding protein [unclassified Achromobacter]OWT73687.1 branched-chain amino acid ABC transporter substrate-binding protein [Achromobacter sp. HZ34]OWT79397.1 branched-chain amino acid ABC transporter substrate-binding protein [Achromobacter sp. HZ28]